MFLWVVLFDRSRKRLLIQEILKNASRLNGIDTNYKGRVKPYPIPLRLHTPYYYFCGRMNGIEGALQWH
jgi:hypothetical protein